MANLIQYNGDSKVIKRICELLNTAMSPVQDVKVNGESVLDEDGVAEIHSAKVKITLIPGTSEKKLMIIRL